jgi:mRNA-degrading endonuclease RelE of RelBE toxin-antitoxin system
MRQYRPRFTREASHVIAHLSPEAKRLIRASIDELIASPAKGNELQMELSGFRSLRSKKYRIIYKMNENDASIDIYYVGPRKDVYNNFRELLERWRRRD